jgi:hypothetical protein
LPSFAGLFRAAEDGCRPADADPRQVAALVNQVVIAEYRLAFGKDTSDASLAPAYLQREFGAVFGSEQLDGG